MSHTFFPRWSLLKLCFSNLSHSFFLLISSPSRFLISHAPPISYFSRRSPSQATVLQCFHFPFHVNLLPIKISLKLRSSNVLFLPFSPICTSRFLLSRASLVFHSSPSRWSPPHQDSSQTVVLLWSPFTFHAALLPIRSLLSFPSLPFDAAHLPIKTPLKLYSSYDPFLLFTPLTSPSGFFHGCTPMNLLPSLAAHLPIRFLYGPFLLFALLSSPSCFLLAFHLFPLTPITSPSRFVNKLPSLAMYSFHSFPSLQALDSASSPFFFFPLLCQYCYTYFFSSYWFSPLMD